MQTIPALPRIGHSAPVDFQRIEDLAQSARASLHALGRATEGSNQRSHVFLGQIAFGAAGQIGIYTSEAA